MTVMLIYTNTCIDFMCIHKWNKWWYGYGFGVLRHNDYIYGMFCLRAAAIVIVLQPFLGFGNLLRI